VNSLPGKYTLSLSGGSDNEYYFEYKSGILTITKIPLQVIANDTIRTKKTANPNFRISYLGYLNDDNENILDTKPVAICNANADSDAGDYPIEFIEGSDNEYEMSYSNGILTVTKIPLLVIASDTSRFVNELNPEFRISYKGFINDDDESELDKKPFAYSNATKASPSGTYEIVAEGGEDNDYEMSYKHGILTVLSKTSIKKSRVNKINIYPNPMDSYLLMEFQDYKNISYSLSTVIGDIIEKGSIHSNSQRLNVEKLSPGIYLLNIKKGNELSVFKIVKQ
jgi:hypothetical protein